VAGSAEHDGADLDSLTDLQTPWCVHVVATLRIAEHLQAGVTAIDDLAEASGCHARALHNVLGHLVHKGVFLEPTPGEFALNDAARQLLDGSKFLDLNGIGGRMAGAWSTLPTYVRTGRPGYHEVFGLPFWEDLAAHPDVAGSFDDLIGPGGHGTPDASFEVSGGWEQVRTVVDVGGGTGAMLAELLRTRPAVQGTLVDLPGTVARAGHTFEDARVADRATLAGQSFFDPLPPGADLYLVRHVLNDWPDEETVAILRRCAEAAGRDGRVVVMGGVSPDDAPRRLVIEMVLVGGVTNSLAEFRELAGRAGLEVVQAERQGREFVVECRSRRS
jgi:2,7-dihydroxy-5-methyl-1-naphthoate 7-O-methyltransferase